MTALPFKLDLYHTVIPMKGFDHAAHKRKKAESILAKILYDDGHVGWGETLPREYVTGETYETVIQDIENIVWPRFVETGQLTYLDGDRCINAAAAAVDVAATRDIIDDPQNVDPERIQHIAGRETLRTEIEPRVTGVLGSAYPPDNAKKLRLMRWFGLKDFKLKLGLHEINDHDSLQLVHKQLRKGIEKGKYTLRVDINGGWKWNETPQKIEELKQYGVCVVEQPVYGSALELVSLAQKCDLPLMADESLLTEKDADTLISGGGKHPIWWNIRISKNGGILGALKLMRKAEAAGVPFTLGCMVGETSILSAAQRRLLQLGPVPRFIEGNYGRFLMSGDLLKGGKSLRFGYGGRLKPLPGNVLGVTVDRDKVHKYGKLVKSL